MSDETILLLRAAFQEGAQWAFRAPSLTPFADGRRAAAAAYPLSPVPREVKDPESGFPQVWSVVDGVLGYRPYLQNERDGWGPAFTHGNVLWEGHVNFPTPARIRLWFDLLNNPTEPNLE